MPICEHDGSQVTLPFLNCTDSQEFAPRYLRLALKLLHPAEEGWCREELPERSLTFAAVPRTRTPRYHRRWHLIPTPAQQQIPSGSQLPTLSSTQHRSCP